MANSFDGLTTTTIVSVLTQLGLPGCFMTGVRPLTPASRFEGPARTLRCLPLREDVARFQQADITRSPHRMAIDDASVGEVLVIDARGELRAGVAGDNFVGRLKALGAAALVTDGCVRDLAGITDLGFPTFASGTHASPFGTQHVGIAINEPIACGGVLVMPGDTLVGDQEGVVVVPRAMTEQVAALARERSERDDFSLRKIVQERLPLARAYPLDEALKAEFEAGRRSDPQSASDG